MPSSSSPTASASSCSGASYTSRSGAAAMTVKLRSCTNSGPLEAAFFNRPADTVARALVGKTLVCRVSGGEQALMVVETEAYLGPHDLACHAARGRTPRTDVMFGPPGMLYIYLVYGLHW